MSTEPSPPGAPPTIAQASPGQLAWLDDELPRWVADGLLTPESAAAIRGRYATSRRFSLVRLAVTLGAVFVAIGLIWLVASNLDRLSPLTRVILIGVIWIALLLAAEWAGGRAKGPESAAPLTMGLRLLAVAGYGAFVYQCADSLQVPTDTPALVGIWTLGSLAHGFAVRSIVPWGLGAALLGVWFVVRAVHDQGDERVLGLALVGVGVFVVGVGVLHEARWWPEASLPWRELGALGVLLGALIAGLPSGSQAVPLPWLVWVGAALGTLAAGAAFALAGRLGRSEAALALGGLAMAVLFTLWSPGEDLWANEGMSTTALVRSLVAVLLYLVVAIGYAVLGTIRGSWRITVLALIGLTGFVTFQAFAVFATLLSGAALFVLVGLVLIGTGLLADRGRRRLAVEAKEVLT